ncbi:MAG: hypothetical protein AAGF79_06525, partial [Pseudomonadota bacterium]
MQVNRIASLIVDRDAVHVHHHAGQVGGATQHSERDPPARRRTKEICQMVKVRGIEFQGNTDNDMGLE